MSDLVQLHAHADVMAGAVHKPNCPWSRPEQCRPRAQWRLALSGPGLQYLGHSDPPPPCDGCVTTAERALWRQIADEISAYLAQEPATEGQGLW